MTAFADTGYYVALLNAHDRLHQTAISAASTYDGNILTSEYVLLELGNFLSRFARKHFPKFYA